MNRSSRLALPSSAVVAAATLTACQAPARFLLHQRLLAHLVIDSDSGVEVALLGAVPIRRRLQRRREEHFEALRATQRSTERKEGGEVETVDISNRLVHH